MSKNLFFKNNNKSKKFCILIINIVILCIMTYIFYSVYQKIKSDISSNNKQKSIELMGKNDMNNNDTNVKFDYKPLWNLNDLYSSFDDPKIKDDLKYLKESIDLFENKYKGRIGKISANDTYFAMIEYETINELMGKLASYAYLKYAENLTVDDNVKFYQSISEELTALSSKLSFFTIEINELPKEIVNFRLSKSKGLRDSYGTFISNLRLFKDHQLSLELEEYDTEKSITGSQAWSRLFDETIDGMKFNFEGKELNQAEILEILNGSDSKKRKKAGKIFGEKLGENIKLLAYITNTLAKDKSISDKWRKFKTPIQSRNLSNLIEDEVVESLYNSVQENYVNISHRYYELKAKILKQHKLHYTDRNAPLPFDDNKIYTWEEAKNIVLDAYKSFSPKMAEIGQLFFDNNWIDAPTRVGKMGGAFMHPSVPSVHPYILLNYQGKARDVMTLAHELGHGIHQYLAKDRGYFMSDTPLTLAETASVFGEQLVFRYLLSKETDRNKKIAIIANKIEDMINTVVRQIAFLEFEKTVHEERKNGEISVDRLNEIWMSVQSKSLGDIFEYDEEYKYYWAYIPHFIHSPFYVYAYAFGDCLVNSLFYKFIENPDGFQDKYINLLSAGGSKKYIELLKPFGLNPRDKEFWNNGMSMISNLINELEELLL